MALVLEDLVITRCGGTTTKLDLMWGELSIMFTDDDGHTPSVDVAFTLPRDRQMKLGEIEKAMRYEALVVLKAAVAQLEKHSIGDALAAVDAAYQKSLKED